MIVLLDKPGGWTPLEALQAVRSEDPALRETPMVYAGRLDPMAEGLLLVLAGETRHTLPAHLLHDKTYEASFLFGRSSDTHDALGRLLPGRVPPDPEHCAEAVRSLAGTHTLPIPAWSSYRVRGRALHVWAQAGKLGEIERPERAMDVCAVRDVHTRVGTAGDVSAEARVRIGEVRGTFRQAQAAADWEALDPWLALVEVHATLDAGSGTYVRALAHALGERLGCGALLWRLRRTRVGPYRIEDATRPGARPAEASAGEKAGA